MVVKDVKKEGINYDSFRDLNISKEVIKKIINNIKDIDKTNLDNLETNINRTNNIIETSKSGHKDWGTVDALTLSMMIYQYNLIEKGTISKRHMNYLYDHLYYNNSFLELKGYYTSILKDIRYFPVPRNKNGDSYVTFDDSWNAYRNYGGNRRHEGTDLMPDENKRGYYPIISMTDGVVEKLGWLEQGGYRVGIRGNAGAYFYYAHLDSYAQGLEIGDSIKAGDLLGYMGDTGYGEEGTTGMFDVHLHFGIYVDTPFGELSVNPYHILLYLQEETNN
jgi:murein DD-endopeptidase MepM/ murein hydrolase activator NlpD